MTLVSTVRLYPRRQLGSCVGHVAASCPRIIPMLSGNMRDLKMICGSLRCSPFGGAQPDACVVAEHFIASHEAVLRAHSIPPQLSPTDAVVGEERSERGEKTFWHERGQAKTPRCFHVAPINHVGMLSLRGNFSRAASFCSSSSSPSLCSYTRAVLPVALRSLIFWARNTILI